MTSPSKLYHVIQITFQMWSRDQSLVAVALQGEKLSQPRVDQKKHFFERCSWFKFNMAFKLYASVAKRFKLKVQKSWRLIPTFVEVTREKLVRRGGWGVVGVNRLNDYRLYFIAQIILSRIEYPLCQLDNAKNK